MNETGEIKYEVGGDNIYADLELPDADLLLAKSNAVIQILKMIEGQRLSDEEAIGRMGVTNEDLYRFRCGQSGDRTLDDLVRLMNRLGGEVRVVFSERVTI